MIALLKEFCRESSLHGLLPIVLNENSRRERWFWGCIFGFTAVIFVSQIYSLAQEISHSPVDMIVDNPNYDLKHVEFPAVTVCSNSKVIKSKLVSHVANNLNLRLQLIQLCLPKNSSRLVYYVEIEQADLRVVSCQLRSGLEPNWLLAEPLLSVGTLSELSPNESEAYFNTILALDLLRYPYYYLSNQFATKNVKGNVFPIPREDITDVMEKVRPSVGEIFKNCRWNGQPRNCRLLFRHQLTEEGFCLSFNSKSAERSRLDPPALPPTALPDGSLECLRNNIAGRGAGLFFELSYLGYELFEDHFLPQGYSVIIHNPNIFPDNSHKYNIFFKNFSYSRFSVSVVTVKADESLYRISDDIRGCELTKTKSADYYSCHFKCRQREMLRECGCLPYFMYSSKSHAEVCGIDQFECLGRNNIKFRNPFSPQDSNEGIPQWSVPEVMNCSCSFSCDRTTYWANHVHVPREEEDGILGFTEALATVEVTYESPFATSYLKRASFTVDQFIVEVGGVGGLLISCSVISFVELIIIAYKLVKEAYFQVVIKKNIIYPFNE